MFHPWRPLDREWKAHPSLKWHVDDLGVTVWLEEWSDSTCQIAVEIRFDHLVGQIATDESIHFVSPYFPKEEELQDDGSVDLPWPIWRSSTNYRRDLYTDFASEIYGSVVSYLFHGSETVLLLDVNDSEPKIRTVGPGERDSGSH